MISPLNNIDRAIEKIRNGVNDLIKQGFVPIVNQEISTEILTPEGDFVFISQAMSRKPEVSKQMWELEKLAQTPCYDHTQCGEDCLPDCPHYAERKPEEKAKPAYTKEPWRVGNYHCCVVSDTPIPEIDSESSVEYYGGHIICESCTDANADRIVACVNACAGITTEALNKGIVKGCIEGMRRYNHNMDKIANWMGVPVYEEESN